MAFNHASLVRPNSFKLIHEIGQALDKGLESDLIYLDFEKAFDSVCHTKLLVKLECYGICDPLLKWFKSYLHICLQCVVIKGLCSAWKDVKSGVPQESLLEYLDILFFFKCKLEYINFCIDNYISFCTGSSRRGASGSFVKNVYTKTSLFRDCFFVRIPNL